MQVIDNPAECHPPADGTVITIGAYDGVHVGQEDAQVGDEAKHEARRCQEERWEEAPREERREKGRQEERAVASSLRYQETTNGQRSVGMHVPLIY